MSLINDSIQAIDKYLRGDDSEVVISTLPLGADFQKKMSDDSSFNIPVTDVANWFISVCNESDEAEGISNLKLQKLLYYAQGVSLQYTGKRLFNENIEAWDYGSVVPEVYSKYKKWGRNPIDTAVGRPVFDHDVQVILTDVFQEYGQYSVWKLVQMIHDEMPWKTTKKGCVIPIEKIKQQFQ